MIILALAVTILGGYLLGSIPFGYLFAKAKGVNIFEVGSGNIGATNVGRVLGKRIGFLVFLLDFLKGAAPTLIASFLWRSQQKEMIPHLLPVLAGVSAFLGHLFPIYLRFRGGKGVATAAGIVAILLPIPTFVALLCWLVVVSMTWYVALASIVAALALCVIRLTSVASPFGTAEIIPTCFCLLITLLVVVRHHSNIRRLLAGEENTLKDPTIMFNIGKMLHTLAVGLWFGASIFFTFVVGFSLFATMEEVTEKRERPFWLPTSKELEKDLTPEQAKKARLSHPLRKEQGSRIAGHAITPMFDWYFSIQMICAVIATATALGWSWKRFPQKLHRARSWILVLALVTVIGGWWIEKKVSDLRIPRNEKTDAFLKSDATDAPDDMIQARKTFGAWHGISMLVNLLTVLLVLSATTMAAFLPPAPHVTPPPPKEQESA